MNREIEKHIHLMKEQYDRDISMYAQSFLEKSIQCRMISMNCDTTEDYLLYLHRIPEESNRLLDQLSNSYSEFFRNPLTFASLEQLVLPMLIEKKKKYREKGIRIWSAACASGQEAYSIAMLLDELSIGNNTGLTLRIFATDVNPEEISSAQKGIYPASSLEKVSLKRIKTYFTREGETYTVVPHLHDRIDFSVFDLLSDFEVCPPASIYGNFDLVFCSNLLFYYQAEHRQRILDKIGSSLAPGGYLITGDSEREIVRQHQFREVFEHSAIFQKR